MNSRINFLSFFVGIIVFTSFLAGCGDEDITTTISTEEQQEMDSLAIAAYITEQDFDPAALDTTRSGVIYMVMDEGTGEEISYNDIVDIFLSIQVTDGTLLLSNIDTVLQKHDAYDSTAVYNPLIISHTPSGWALAPPENNFLSMQGFLGVRDGVTAILNELKVGGRGLIITPSIVSLQTGLSGSVTSYPLREVLVLNVYPTRVR